MADDIQALAKAFLEEVAVHGAGPFADRPAFNALRAALRPVPVAPPAIPLEVKGGSEPLASSDHLAALSEA